MANDRLSETANDPIPIEGLDNGDLIDTDLITQWVEASKQRTMVYIARVRDQHDDYDVFDMLVGVFASETAAMEAVVDWYRDACYDDDINANTLDEYSDSFAYIIDKVPVL